MMVPANGAPPSSPVTRRRPVPASRMSRGALAAGPSSGAMATHEVWPP